MIGYTNQLGQVTKYTYDVLSRKTGETNANNEVTTFSYSPAGDLVTLTDGANHNTTALAGSPTSSTTPAPRCSVTPTMPMGV